MKGRDDEQIHRVMILKFTLIAALKEIIESNYPDTNHPVRKTYLKVLDKKTKNPDEIFITLSGTMAQLQAGKARNKFKLITVEKNSDDVKLIGYIKDILKILNDNKEGVNPAIDAAISLNGSLKDARTMAEGMAELKASQRTGK